MVVSEWMIEEASEFALATTNAERVDALFDVLGVILAALICYGTASIASGYKHYVSEMERRARPLDSPHQRAISHVVSFLTQRMDAAAAEFSASVFTRRAQRYDAAAREAHVKRISSSAKSFKMSRRADP